MLRKGDKAPFIIRTILIMLAVYLSLMLAATWCMQAVFEVGADINPWIYAMTELKVLYILSLLLMVVLTAILIAAHNSVIEDKFESERRRRLMMDSMAHDMKTPLSIIRNYGELLLESGTQTKREEYAQTIIDESERMNEAVVSLLDLSKMEAGTYPMDLNDFHIREVIEETVGRYGVLFVKKNIKAVIDAPQELRMFADRKLITRALSNFISNGIHNGTPGTEMKIAAKKISNAVRIQVHNSGQYLDDEEMKHIWEAYYQQMPGKDLAKAGNSQQVEPSGSGLGLAIVRNICLLHGGSYGCENENNGVTFWMQISSQENRIGKMDILTGPVTGVTESVNPMKGVGLIAIGTLIQGIFWTVLFFEDFINLIHCLFHPDNGIEIMITDTTGLIAAGIGTGFIFYGTKQLQKSGWPVRRNVITDICLMIVIALAVLLTAAVLFLNSEQEVIPGALYQICLVLETAISITMAVLMLSHYRILTGITGALNMVRRSRNLQRQMILVTVILGLYIGVLLTGIANDLPYAVIGSGWLLVCAFSAGFWILVSRGMTAFEEEKLEFSELHKAAGRMYLGVAICIILMEIAFAGWIDQNSTLAMTFIIAFAIAAGICMVLTIHYNRLENKARKEAGLN